MTAKQVETVDNAATSRPVKLPEGLALTRLAPLDTICVQTRNSNYRIFLLDPETGRALIEGGHFVEPVDALVVGSVGSRSTFKVGSIGIGMRIEFWANNILTSTSPVQSFHVESHTNVEPMPTLKR